MSKVSLKLDPAKIWSLNYRLLTQVITSVAPAIAELGVEAKELFALAEIDAHPFPAELASVLCTPKPTMTLVLKRLEAGAFVKREIDPSDLRRHKLTLTPEGRKVSVKGLALLSKAYEARLARLTQAEQAELRRLLEKMEPEPAEPVGR